MGNDLTKTERSELIECEAVIEHGRTTFVEVGNALAAIREKKLYRETHETFDTYCKERWGYTRDYACKLIGSASIAEQLQNVDHGIHSPANERQVRPLLQLSEPSEDDHRERVVNMKAVKEVWQQVVEKAPKDADGKPQVTAKLVTEAVKEYGMSEEEKVLAQDAKAQAIRRSPAKTMKLNGRALADAPLSVRALAARDDIAERKDAAKVRGHYGFTLHQYRSAKIVGESNNAELIDAMDSGLVKPNTALCLTRKSVEQIRKAINDARAKVAEAGRKKLSVRGKSRSTRLMELLDWTWLAWRGFRREVGLKVGTIPKDRKEQQRVAVLCQNVREEMDQLFSFIESEVAKCLQRTRGENNS